MRSCKTNGLARTSSASSRKLSLQDMAKSLNLWRNTNAKKTNNTPVMINDVCNDFTCREVTETSEATTTTTCDLHGQALLMEIRNARDKCLRREQQLQKKIATEVEQFFIAQMMGGGASCYDAEEQSPVQKTAKHCQRERNKLHSAIAILELYLIHIECDLHDDMAACHQVKGNNDSDGYPPPEHDDEDHCKKTLDFREYESFSEEVNAILR
jgi:hypothetical protein